MMFYRRSLFVICAQNYVSKLEESKGQTRWIVEAIGFLSSCLSRTYSENMKNILEPK